MDSSDLRVSPPLFSWFCCVSQHCEASGRFYCRGDLIKPQHFDEVAAGSFMHPAPACVCVCA